MTAPICVGCRVRHLECDSNATCFECEKAGRPCKRGYDVRFRYSVCPLQSPSNGSKHEFSFEKDQTWVETNDKVEFILEDGLDSFEPLPLQSKQKDSILLSEDTTTVEDRHATAPPDNTIGTSSNPRVSKYLLTDDSPAPLKLHAPVTDRPLVDAIEKPRKSYENFTPLKTLREAQLLQWFTKHLAPWVSCNRQGDEIKADVHKV